MCLQMLQVQQWSSNKIIFLAEQKTDNFSWNKIQFWQCGWNYRFNFGIYKLFILSLHVLAFLGLIKVEKTFWVDCVTVNRCPLLKCWAVSLRLCCLHRFLDWGGSGTHEECLGCGIILIAATSSQSFNLLPERSCQGARGTAQIWWGCLWSCVLW